MSQTHEPITRAGTARELIADLHNGDRTEGMFSSVGMVTTDAALTGDRDTLHVLHDGLRRMLGGTLVGQLTPEQRGRVLGLIDGTTWALRRLG